MNIIQGDCVLEMQKIQTESIDLTVTSAAYDNMRDYKGYSFDFENTARELYRVTKNGGVVVWIVGDETINGSETGTSFRQALFFKECGFALFDTMIYEKSVRGAVGNNRTYWQTFEYMFVISKGKPATIHLICDRPNKESRDGDNGTKRLSDGSLKKLKRAGYGEYGRRTNIWRYQVGKNHSTKDVIASQHPAIFPELLAQDHILSWSNPGNVVLDPFMGSGTTGKMATLNGREFIGIDISPEYCELARKRIEGEQNVGLFSEIGQL